MEMMEISISEVFEKMYFIFLEPDEFGDTSYTMGASIDFGGSAGGNMRLLFSRQISAAMVQNMLNMEKSEIPDQDIEDCLKEAANMVCGSLLSKIDTVQRLEMHIPVFLKSADLTINGQDPIKSVAFISDAGTLGAELRLFLE